MRNAIIVFLTILGINAAGATTALPDMKGTVDAWTPAMLDKARDAAMNAGYHPTAVEFVQDGNVFLTAVRNNEVYGVLLTKSGKFFASNGIPESPTGSGS
jgi:hypothetical protein